MMRGEYPTEKFTVSPSGVYFRDCESGTQYDTLITVTAETSALTVKNIVVSNPDFSIAPTSFSLTKGESKQLLVTFTQGSESYSYAKFEFESEPCVLNFIASGGSGKGEVTIPPLKLAAPNGGEVFVVGDETEISWEGVLPNDTISLSLSRDAGENWEAISDSGTNLKYNWRDIKGPASDECLVKAVSISQNRAIEGWQGNYDGDGGKDIIQTLDGGYIVTSTDTYTDPKDNTKLIPGVLIVKTSPVGDEEWRYFCKNYRTYTDISIAQMFDGSYIVISSTLDSGVPGYHSKSDIYMIHLDQSGQEVFLKAIGGSGNDRAKDIELTNDGGYVICGESHSKTGDMEDVNGEFLVMKFSSNNSIEWQKRIGLGVANSIKQTNDGGFIVAGYSLGESTKPKHVYRDMKVVRLDAAGNTAWVDYYGGNYTDEANCIVETNDDGFMFVGTTHSYIGDLTGYHENGDLWAVKIDADGNMQWQTCLGGEERDEGFSCTQLPSGVYVAVGATKSVDGDLTGYNSTQTVKMWKLMLDPDGKMLEQYVFGRSVWEGLNSVITTRDGGFIVTGRDLTTRNPNDSLLAGPVYVKKYAGIDCYASDTSDEVFSIVVPECEITDIDMEKCLITARKDSIISGFYKNISDFACRIDTVFFRGNDAPAFSLVSSCSGFSIEKQSAGDIEISFAATEAREYDAELVVVTQADSLFAGVTGEGVEPTLKIINAFIDFGTVHLGNAKDSLRAVTITNVGSKMIYLTDIIQGGPNITDFSVLDGKDIDYLLPGDTVKLDLRFKPSSTGRMSGSILFEYGDVGSPATVELFGNGKGVPILESDAIEYPDLLCEIDASFEVVFRNVGDDYLDIDEAIISGKDAIEFRQSSAYIPVRLYPGESDTIEILYEPSGPGFHEAHLILTSSAYDPETHNMKLEGTKNTSRIVLPSSVVFAQEAGVFPTSTTFEIENTGSLPFNFNLPIQKGKFTITSVEPNPIPPGKIADATIVCESFEAGEFSEIIEILNLCNEPAELKAICSIDEAAATLVTLSIPEMEANSKTYIKVPIVVEKFLQRSAVNDATFSFDLTYNPTILFAPREEYLMTGDSTATIRIEDIEFDFEAGEQISEVIFITGLGNAESCVLEMSNPEVSGGNAEIEFNNGSFTLTNICREGGTRLLEPTMPEDKIIKISPNPASGEVEIKLDLIERGYTTLKITDNSGKEIKTLLNEEVEVAGERTITFDCSGFGSGMYYLVFSSPGISRTESLEIVK
jgi:hypothetical protein